MTQDGNGLTRRQLADLLDRHGARLSSWPEEMRSAAERLFATDSAARAMFEAAASVDIAVHALMQGEAPRRVRTLSNHLVPSWRRLAGFSMAALAASLAIGFAVGTTLPSSDDDDGSDYTTIAVNDIDLGGVL